MKLIIAFLGLIRGLNLLFIIVTQVLFQYFILIPIFSDAGMKPFLHERLFILLVIASVFIAAAGYIINDYFDLNIDQVNKPHKLVVEKIIKRRWAILWHLSLSFIGIMISLYVGWKVNNMLIGFANILCVVLLWLYSTTFKRKLLIGNVIISLLSAWVVLVLYFSEWDRYFDKNITPKEMNALTRVFRFSFLYAGFAFIISLIREVIKDIEDMPGDAKYGCTTMPIVWGVHVSKVFISTWLAVMIASLGIVQFYVLQFRWWWSFLYCFVMIIFPLLFIFKKLLIAHTAEDFHKLSGAIKLVMLTGILSMIFLGFIHKPAYCNMKSIVLASQSPRRKQLLEWAEIEFDILVKETDESFPGHLSISDVPVHIARNKALAVQQSDLYKRYESGNIILAADTIVVLDDSIIGKPVDEEEAIRILTRLSGKTHHVITGVVMMTDQKEIAFSDTTEVSFHKLSAEQINHYVGRYRPLDKAGAYAIQEWIGVTGIKSIHGDFYNVMGLPVSRVVAELKNL